MTSILFSIRSKGLRKYLKRGQAIVTSYGLTSSKMSGALNLFSQIVQDFQCAATLPVTAIAVERNGKSVEKYLAQGIEFALHGYRHINHAQLTLDELRVHLGRAREAFVKAGIPVVGFRAPYLCFNEDLYLAASEIGLKYVSNQPIWWNVVEPQSFSAAARIAYERAFAFYQPWLADEQVSTPRLYNQLVEIPVSLPDDEILVDRLGSNGDGLVERTWLQMLTETYQREELFTLQLHPERIAHCAAALLALLAQARAFDPPIWIAQLAEIAAWWQARYAAMVKVVNIHDDLLQLIVSGPAGTTLLLRSVETDAATVAWHNGYQLSKELSCKIYAHKRPFIGVSPDVSPVLISFLKQQGFIVETSSKPEEYSFYYTAGSFSRQDERRLLAQIEAADFPLVRLGRWPNGARSALSVTGDIDALTLWDYGLRFLGK